MSTNNASFLWWVTVAWLLISFHGAMLTLMRLLDGLADRHWLRERDINGARSIMANVGIRSAGARLWLFGTFFVIGVNALLGPDAPAPALRAVLTSGLLILALIVQAVVAQLDARDSTRLMTMLQIARAVEAERTSGPDNPPV